MTKEELMATPQFLDKYDIMNIFKCGSDRAMAIIRGIKSVSDTLKLKGKVTLADYYAWYNRKSGDM